jgi:hypothetical protein
MTEKIEYEQVTIKVPTRIMAFLRFQAAQQEMQIEEHIEYQVLDSVRAEMEGFEGEELIGMLGVGPIFYEILGDKTYKPEEVTN